MLPAKSAHLPPQTPQEQRPAYNHLNNATKRRRTSADCPFPTIRATAPAQLNQPTRHTTNANQRRQAIKNARVRGKRLTLRHQGSNSPLPRILLDQTAPELPENRQSSAQHDNFCDAPTASNFEGYSFRDARRSAIRHAAHQTTHTNTTTCRQQMTTGRRCARMRCIHAQPHIGPQTKG